MCKLQLTAMVSRETIKALFDPLLQGIVSVMEDQMMKATSKGCRVEVRASMLLCSQSLTTWSRKLF